MVLKVMHVVHHIEARELKSRLTISDREGSYSNMNSAAPFTIFPNGVAGGVQPPASTLSFNQLF